MNEDVERLGDGFVSSRTLHGVALRKYHRTWELAVHWLIDAPEVFKPIPLGEHNGREIICLVSAEDYEWAMQWKWRYKLDKRGKKYYAVRHGRVYKRGPVPSCKQVDFYLHKQILKHRMKKRPRTRAHKIGDHGDGNSLNNCQYNLAWVTASKNCKTCRIKPQRGDGGRFRVAA